MGMLFLSWLSGFDCDRPEQPKELRAINPPALLTVEQVWFRCWQPG
jgi:hypothetical protein